VEFENKEPVSLKRHSANDKDEAGVSDILLDLTRHQAQGDSIRLAELIQARLAEVSPYPNRGVKQAPFGVLKGAAMPAVVCEIGFINHRREGVYITSEKGLEEIGLAIAKGIIDYGDLVYDTRIEKGTQKP
jgi:N-acetylmuramoyl-L-alanine amidase